MTLTEVLRETSINVKALADLVKDLSQDREALLQLLLGLSTKTTFQRIINCPTYPISVLTQDLDERKKLLLESITSNQYEIAFALAYLYENVADRQSRKKFGQFFTSPYVARVAVNQLNIQASEFIVDAGCGTGIFPLTLISESIKKKNNPDNFTYLGIENSPLLALSCAIALEIVGAPKSWHILYANFLSTKLSDIQKVLGENKKIDVIISNPPYVRCHQLGERAELTDELDLLGNCGLHSFFLGHSSKLVDKGRMLFLIPIEMKGTKYGSAQFKKLDSKFRIENEILFVDSIDKIWKKSGHEQIPLTLYSKIRQVWNIVYLKPVGRDVKKDSIITQGKLSKPAIQLCSFAKVHRGISSGANDFFVINQSTCEELGLNETSGFLTKIIPTRIPKNQLKNMFTAEDWQSLKMQGRPIWLLSFPRCGNLSDTAKEYINKGVGLGIHLIPTSKSRQPWFHIKIPKSPPDLFFTYISRGYPLFIANKARVYNLTNMLGVYFENYSIPTENQLETFVSLLNVSLEEWFNHAIVGRRYKGGIVKLEPKDLEKMPIPEAAINMLKGFKSIQSK